MTSLQTTLHGSKLEFGIVQRLFFMLVSLHGFNKNQLQGSILSGGYASLLKVNFDTSPMYYNLLHKLSFNF